MDYNERLQKIDQALSVLDNTSYNTIEEANRCLIKYDKLKDDVIQLVKQLLEDSSKSEFIKGNIFNRAIQILTNHIGSSDDIVKYGDILESFFKEGQVSKEQLNFFYEKLDTGRWL